MKVKEPQIARALEKPDGKIRLYLLYGPDDASARALATHLDRAMGADAERIDLDGATLKEDPARLSDEAAAISLFGDKRFVRVTGGDECTAAVEALLESATSGDPVVMISGALKPSSTLLKRVLDDPAVMACQCFKLEGANAEQLAATIARNQGVRLGPGVAQGLIDATLGDRAILERELEKIALFLDAAPDRPREATRETLDAIGAGLDESDTAALVDAVMSGKLAATAQEITALEEAGSGAIPALRAFARRLTLLARLRAEVDAGKSAASVMGSAGRALHFKERDAVALQLTRWDSARIATAASRIFAAEAAMKMSGTAGEVLATNELVALARVAERRR